PLYTDQVFFEVQLAGLQPVVAHPERNTAIQNDLGLLRRLVERGALGQVTAASLTGAFGPRARTAAEAMLRRTPAPSAAPDRPAPEAPRAPPLPAGRAAAARLVGEDRARAMVEDIPRAILAGAPVTVDPPPEEPPKRRWKFWG